MNFKPELAEKVMRGEKTVTRRLVSENPRSPWCRWKVGLTVGRDYAVCPGRSKHAIGRVRITNVYMQRLGEIITFEDKGAETAAEVRREGFATFPEFHRAWAAINGQWDPNALVWRVEFEVA